MPKSNFIQIVLPQGLKKPIMILCSAGSVNLSYQYNRLLDHNMESVTFHMQTHSHHHLTCLKQECYENRKKQDLKVN